MTDFLYELWDSVCSLGDCLRDRLKWAWRTLGTPAVATLLTVATTSTGAYYAYRAAEEANQTSKRSLEVSERAEKAANDAEKRARLENVAELAGKLERRLCALDQFGHVRCQYVFTLTNAGKNTASHITTIVAKGYASSLTDSLSGELPPGQATRYETSDAEGYTGDDSQPLVLAVAYFDASLGVCRTKGWAYRAIAPADGSATSSPDFAAVEGDQSTLESNEDDARTTMLARGGIQCGDALK